MRKHKKRAHVKGDKLKAIILAAGMGTRLGTMIPKPLTAIENEKVIIDYQVEAFSEYLGPHNIYVVVGYKKELIMERHPQLIYIYNNQYAHTNTAKSLLMAAQKLNDEDVIWINGDVIFEKRLIKKLINTPQSCSLVDREKCGSEEIKYSCYDDNCIKYISKVVKNALGESLGMNKIVNGDLNKFKKALFEVGDKDYFEAALEKLTLTRDLLLKPVDKEELYCKEIDFAEDLQDVIRNFPEK